MTIRRHILTHTLGPLRLGNGGAGPVDFHPRFMGLRHDPRNRRPREPYVHGREPRQTPVVILDVVTTCGCTVPEFTKRPIRPGEKNDSQGNVRPDQPPRRLHQGAGRLLLRAAKGRHAHHAGQCHAAHQNHRELYPVDAGGGLRLSTTLNAFSYIRPGQQVQSAIGYA